MVLYVVHRFRYLCTWNRSHVFCRVFFPCFGNLLFLVIFIYFISVPLLFLPMILFFRIFILCFLFVSRSLFSNIYVVVSNSYNCFFLVSQFFLLPCILFYCCNLYSFKHFSSLEMFRRFVQLTVHFLSLFSVKDIIAHRNSWNEYVSRKTAHSSQVIVVRINFGKSNHFRQIILGSVGWRTLSTADTMLRGSWWRYFEVVEPSSTLWCSVKIEDVEMDSNLREKCQCDYSLLPWSSGKWFLTWNNARLSSSTLWYPHTQVNSLLFDKVHKLHVSCIWLYRNFVYEYILMQFIFIIFVIKISYCILTV